MKIRVTMLTENDEHLDESITKEEVESKALLGWTIAMNMLTAAGGKYEKATIESCELVER